MAVDSEFGVFNNILNLGEDQDAKKPVTYNVYQVKSQTPTLSDQDIQRLYGTDAFPVFQWAKAIKTGERTFTPGDDFDEEMMDKYKNFGQLPEGYPTAQEIMAQRALEGTVGQIGMSVGKSIGSEFVNPYNTDGSLTGGTTFNKIKSGIMKTGQDTGIEATNLARFSELGDKSKDALKISGLEKNYLPELSSRATADATGNVMQFDRGLETGTLLKKGDVYVPTDRFEDAVTSNIGPRPDQRALAPTTTVSDASRLGTVTDRLNPMTDVGSQNVVSSGVGAGFNFVGRVAAGQDIDEAAKSAADAGFVQYATTALLAATPLAPFATIAGGIAGSFIKPRVICNELMRQGLMDRKLVVLDFKFTRDYLTPTHVLGYHIWAVWVVKQMRKGRFVKLFRHMATHRANDIAYIYGEKDKPDYLGRLYRKIGEPICWALGMFCKETDWSILYKKKEI